MKDLQAEIIRLKSEIHEAANNAQAQLWAAEFRAEKAEREIVKMREAAQSLFNTDCVSSMAAVVERAEKAERELAELRDAVALIRKSDCGAWLKDCGTFSFRCSDGREKRIELSRLLDNLYKHAEQTGGEDDD